MIQTTVLSNHFQAPHASSGWLEEEPYWFWVTRSKVNFGTLPVKPYWRHTGYRFCPIIFKLRMLVVDDKRRHPFHFRSWDQMLWSNLAPFEGKPLFLLSSFLVTCTFTVTYRVIFRCLYFSHSMYLSNSQVMIVCYQSVFACVIWTISSHHYK